MSFVKELITRFKTEGFPRLFLPENVRLCFELWSSTRVLWRPRSPSLFNVYWLSTRTCMASSVPRDRWFMFWGEAERGSKALKNRRTCSSWSAIFQAWLVFRINPSTVRNLLLNRSHPRILFAKKNQFHHSYQGPFLWLLFIVSTILFIDICFLIRMTFHRVSLFQWN